MLLRRRRRPSPGSSTAKAQKFGADLLAEVREELARADSKAFTLLAAVVVVAGLFAAAILGGSWSPQGMPIVSRVLWWLAAAAFGLGILFLSFAIYPRLGRSARRSGLGYFGEIQNFTSDKEVRTALEADAENELHRTAAQLLVLAKLAARKYRFTQIAIWLFGIAIALGGTAFLLPSVA